MLPIAAIFTIIHFVMGGEKPRAAQSTVYDKAIINRIKPVGSTPDIEKGPSPLVPAPAPVVAAAPADGKAAAGPDGMAVYEAADRGDCAPISISSARCRARRGRRLQA